MTTTETETTPVTSNFLETARSLKFAKQAEQRRAALRSRLAAVEAEADAYYAEETP